MFLFKRFILLDHFLVQLYCCTRFFPSLGYRRQLAITPLQSVDVHGGTNAVEQGYARMAIPSANTNQIKELDLIIQQVN